MLERDDGTTDVEQMSRDRRRAAWRHGVLPHLRFVLSGSFLLFSQS